MPSDIRLLSLADILRGGGGGGSSSWVSWGGGGGTWIHLKITVSLVTRLGRIHDTSNTFFCTSRSDRLQARTSGSNTNIYNSLISCRI